MAILYINTIRTKNKHKEKLGNIYMNLKQQIFKIKSHYKKYKIDMKNAPRLSQTTWVFTYVCIPGQSGKMTCR